MKKEKDYDTYRKRSVVIGEIHMLLAYLLMCFLMILVWLHKSYPLLWIIPAVLFVFEMIISAIVIGKRAKKEKRLKELKYAHKKYKRTGLFAEIWDEYSMNKLERLWINLKEIHNIEIEDCDAFENCIAVSLTLKTHKIDISIEDDRIYILIDDETDKPFEKELLWSNFDSVDNIWNSVTETIVEYCK